MLWAPDIKHTCPNDNSPLACFNLGIKSGQVAGQETKNSHFGYSLAGGVGGQHSPNFSLGYLIGYNRGFGIKTNTNDILRVANKTGFEDGGSGPVSGTSYQALSKPPCTVSSVWCNAYNLAYHRGYQHNIPYGAGQQAGQKYAEHVIDTCTQKEHPDFGFLKHHTSQYRKGFLNAYTDAVAAASNDDGSYGPRRCK
jgi:hypothetical protein